MMEPIPVSRALVPVYPDLPAEKISVADRLFEKEKKLYFLFFLLFVFAASFGAFFVLVRYDEADRYFLADSFLKSSFFVLPESIRSVWEFSLTAVFASFIVFLGGFTVFAPVAALVYGCIRFAFCGYLLAVSVFALDPALFFAFAFFSSMSAFFTVLFCSWVFGYARFSLAGASEMFARKNFFPYLVKFIVYILSILSVDYFYLFVL